jgi:hypothetical protein
MSGDSSIVDSVWRLVSRPAAVASMWKRSYMKSGANDVNGKNAA